jgi:pentatricopeptide repeat protein
VDKITFGSVIHASAKVGNVARAEYWMDEMMRRGVIPNLVCFNTVLHACAHNGDHARAMKWFQKIVDARITPNKITFNSMIDAYAKAGDVKSADMWLQQMVVKGFHPDQITYVTLLRACTHNPPDNSERDPDEHALWTYGSIIKSYAHAGSLSGMKRWLGEMTRGGFKPSQQLAEEVRYSCVSRGKRELGEQIYSLMQRHVEENNQQQIQNSARHHQGGQSLNCGSGQSAQQPASGLPLLNVKPMPDIHPGMSVSEGPTVPAARLSQSVADDISLEEISGQLQKLTEEDDTRDLEPLEPLEPPS